MALDAWAMATDGYLTGPQGDIVYMPSNEVELSTQALQVTADISALVVEVPDTLGVEVELSESNEVEIAQGDPVEVEG